MSHVHRLSVILWIGLLVGSVAAVGPVAAQTGPADGDGTPVVVVFEDHPAKNENAIMNSGGRVTGGQGIDVAPVLFARVNENAIEAIQRAPGVRSVSRDIEVETFDQTVDWGVERVDGPTAANSVNESGTRVAVIDTGVDYDHEDFGDAVAWGANTVGDTTTEGRTAADDGNGHGTHVAGAIAARNNDRGVVGVAPQSSIYAMKALDDNGAGRVSDVIEAIDLAVKGPDGTVGTADDADVLSMSFGASSGSSALQDTLQGASDHALLVAAAGNNGDGDPDTNTVSYPAKYESVIAVAATTRDDETTTWSAEGSEVELAAPGADISSTYPGDEYRSFSGTSMAAPHVSGTAALVIAGEQADGDAFDPGVVRDRLQESTIDIESNGIDTLSGYGLLQADTAVSAVDGPAVEITNPSDGATVSESVTIRSNATDSQDADDALSVEVAVDNGTWETATYNQSSGGYEWAWNTTTLASGEHTIISRVTDSDGNTATDSVTVETAGGQPTVAFEAPEEGDGVSGTVPIRVAANDSETVTAEIDVFYRVNDREWVEMSYDADDARYEASWNASAESDGDYVLGAYAVDEDGFENTTDISVTVQNETVMPPNETVMPPGEQLAGLSQIVHAELEGDLEGRAFGQRIAQAASEQQRAEVIAEQRESIETRLNEVNADTDDPTRNARLQTLEDLSERSAAAVDDLPADAREANGIDREKFEQLQRRAAASRGDRGPPVGVGSDSPGTPGTDNEPGEGTPTNQVGDEQRGNDASDESDDRGPPADAGGNNNTADDRKPGANRDTGRSNTNGVGQNADQNSDNNDATGSNSGAENSGDSDADSDSSQSSPRNSGSESEAGGGSSSSDGGSSTGGSSGGSSNSGGAGSNGGGSGNSGGSGGNSGSAGGGAPGNGGGPP